jgi:hypothetical protein
MTGITATEEHPHRRLGGKGNGNEKEEGESLSHHATNHGILLYETPIVASRKGYGQPKAPSDRPWPSQADKPPGIIPFLGQILLG